MNGREVFKFATRVLVSSAEAMLASCGLTVDDVDVYVPHQANVRIIDHAVRKLGFPEEKVVVNVDRYGNTSSGSIPLALADAADDGRLRPGKPRPDDRDGRRPHVGLGADRLDTSDERSELYDQDGVHVSRARARSSSGMGREIAEAEPEAMAVYEEGSQASGPRPAAALLHRAPPRS